MEDKEKTFLLEICPVCGKAKQHSLIFFADMSFLRLVNRLDTLGYKKIEVKIKQCENHSDAGSHFPPTPSL